MAYISMRDRIRALEQTASAAVSYVGMANYPERQRAAAEAVARSARTGTFVNPEDVECERD